MLEAWTFSDFCWKQMQNENEQKMDPTTFSPMHNVLLYDWSKVVNKLCGLWLDLHVLVSELHGWKSNLWPWTSKANTVKPALNDHRFKRPPAFSDRVFMHGEFAIQTALC